MCAFVYFPSQSPVCNFIDKFVAPGHNRLFLTISPLKQLLALFGFVLSGQPRVSVYRVNTTDLKSDKHKIRVLFFTVTNTNMFSESLS